MVTFRVYLRGNKKIESGVLLLVADNITLALDSETPLLIRSHIIPPSYAFSLRVSLLRENKGDTLCLPQKYPNLLLCCNQPAPPPHLVL